MTFFVVIDLVLRIFPFFPHIFRMFTMLNVVYDHFLTRKTQFFTLFMLSRTSDNIASQNIGGTNAWAVPPTSNFGGTVPRPPLGLRPCLLPVSCPVDPFHTPLYPHLKCLYPFDVLLYHRPRLRSVQRDALYQRIFSLKVIRSRIS